MPAPIIGKWRRSSKKRCPDPRPDWRAGQALSNFSTWWPGDLIAVSIRSVHISYNYFINPINPKDPFSRLCKSLSFKLMIKTN